jgi:queuine/archaeosine tRNA-ribosyltransferase
MTVQRQLELNVGGKVLPLPVYFPSISSVKTALQPQAYMQVLESVFGINNQFLLSAFDLAELSQPADAEMLLKRFREVGGIALMDSGNYESFWKDARHKWMQESFHKMLAEFSCDLAFGFDEQDPPDDFDEHLALLVSRWKQDQLAAGTCQIVPIIHGKAKDLPRLCSAFAAQSGVPMLAVAERRLGEGVIERARTLQAIRSELNKLNRYVCTHLLGTGNPISIALYSAMGADSFDGLEWCQTVVDHDTGLLYHLSQADFFAQQTGWSKGDLSFSARTLAHNLEFYASWMKRLQVAIGNDTVVDFCRRNFPEHVFRHCVREFGWINS